MTTCRVWKAAGLCTHLLEGHTAAVTSIRVVKSNGMKTANWLKNFLDILILLATYALFLKFFFVFGLRYLTYLAFQWTRPFCLIGSKLIVL